MKIKSPNSLFSFGILILAIINCNSFNNKTYIAYINDKKIYIEISITPKERQKGLMKRKSLKENHGMLFVFPKEDYLHFWMKDTYIPLDLAFFDEDGFLIEIQQLEPLSEKIHTSSKPAKYALEMNRNWFAKNDIKPYAKLKFTNEIEEIIKEGAKKYE
ncbi:MAG: DUF192 domain-containing protein [Leptonema sp. (in: bacteria)]